VIAIIGAGSAGLTIAQNLSKSIDPAKFDLVVISERSYFIHLPAGLRLVTTAEGKLEDHAFIPYDKAFTPGKAGRFIFKKVKAVERTLIRFEGEDGSDDHTMRFDWLVVANGAKWEGPLDFPPTLEEAKQFVGDWRRKIASARNIVIAGGGAVGCGAL
jgi:apoptosis-inducing factor 2